MEFRVFLGPNPQHVLTSSNAHRQPTTLRAGRILGSCPRGRRRRLVCGIPNPPASTYYGRYSTLGINGVQMNWSNIDITDNYIQTRAPRALYSRNLEGQGMPGLERLGLERVWPLTVCREGLDDRIREVAAGLRGLLLSKIEIVSTVSPKSASESTDLGL